jgi:hypothetical protein
MPQVAHIARLGPAQFFSVISEKLLQPTAIAEIPSRLAATWLRLHKHRGVDALLGDVARPAASRNERPN